VVRRFPTREPEAAKSVLDFHVCFFLKNIQFIFIAVVCVVGGEMKRGLERGFEGKWGGFDKEK
jgi:hypothetical protein